MSADAVSRRVGTRPACPDCGSTRVVPILHGFPGGDAWEQRIAGTLTFGGCVVSGDEEWSNRWACWACTDREWLAEHTATELRAGRTEHDCADDGLPWNPDTDENGVRLGMRDAGGRFRPAGFITRLWPYLRDVPDPAPGWRPNLERIAEALAMSATEREPDRLTDEDLDELVHGAGLPAERAEALRELRPELERLLGAIPGDVDLHTLDTVAYERHVGLWSPAHAFIRRLRDAGGVTAVDAVRLAARKRPALLAERDSLVDAALDIPDDRQAWRPWWRTLTAEPRLVERLEQLRRGLAAPDLPLLRIAWLSVRSREVDAAAGGGPSASHDLPETGWWRCRHPAGSVDTRSTVGVTEPPAPAEPEVDRFTAWLDGTIVLDLLPAPQRRRALAWLDAGPSIPLEGGPDEPFRRGGTPRGVFHARLVRALSGVDDGQPGWRTPEDRLDVHLHSDRRLEHDRRNWSRGYDDEIVRSVGAYDFGSLPSGAPLDYAEDLEAALVEETIVVALRAAVDEDGFRIGFDEDALTGLMNADDLDGLMDAIPRRVRLEDLDAAGYHAHLSRGSAAWDLVDALMSQGVTEATAWAFCARLRPALVPQPDRVVGALLGLRMHETSRPYWWWALHSDQRLRERLEELRAGADLDDGQRTRLGTLRLAELLVLQRETDRRFAVRTADTLFPFDGEPDEDLR